MASVDVCGDAGRVGNAFERLIGGASGYAQKFIIAIGVVSNGLRQVRRQAQGTKVVDTLIAKTEKVIPTGED